MANRLMSDTQPSKNNIKENNKMAINNRDRQRTRVVFVPVNTGGGSQAKIKVGENGIKLTNSTFTEVPQVFDFSDVTDMGKMFYNCTSLTLVPPMNTSQVTNMTNMFDSCSNLITVSPMDTSNVTTMAAMFSWCQSLATIPEMNTSNVTNMVSMFNWCTSLTSVPEMDTSNVTDMTFMFDVCYLLTDLGGFIGLKVDINLSRCPLTHDSIVNVINKAADVTAAPATMTLGADNLAKLSDEEKGIATAKGWTLA